MVYSVSDFNAVVANYLSDGLGTITVRGEVVDFKVAKERLVFFELKDDQSRVGCFMMKWDLHQMIEDGMEVEVTGRASLFQQSGRFHIRVIDIQLVGAGALARAFQLLKSKLEKEGLFALDRKRPLPRFPEVIGVVTSADAAAYTDVVRIINNRWAGVTIVLAPVAVQGIGAVREIVAGIAQLNARTDVDVIIVTRGGGSIEDLQAFNSEEVARAIYASRLPIVSAIGHERDVTIADLVADQRASTPSNAAERVVPDKKEITHRIDQMLLVMHTQVFHAISRQEEAIQRLLTASSSWMQQFDVRLKQVFRMLESLSPRSTLERGYSITRLKLDDGIVRNATNIRSGSVLVTELARGSIESVTQ